MLSVVARGLPTPQRARPGTAPRFCCFGPMPIYPLRYYRFRSLGPLRVLCVLQSVAAWGLPTRHGADTRLAGCIVHWSYHSIT
jgi:hypothetical protein